MRIKFSFALLVITFLGLITFQSCQQENQKSSSDVTKELSVLPENRDRDNVCVSFIQPVAHCPFEEKVFEFDHPDYPDCHFWITYKERRCSWLEIIYISLGHSGDCTSFDNDNATNGGLYVEKKLADYALNLVIWTYGLEVATDCEAEHNGVLKVYKANCTTKIKLPEFNTSYTLDCGVSCCSTSILFCRDPNTGTVTARVLDQAPLFECKQNIGELPPNVEVLSPCQPNCFDRISSDPPF